MSEALAPGCEGPAGANSGGNYKACDWSSSLTSELLQEVARHVGIQSWGCLRCVCQNWRRGISLAVRTVRLTVPDRSTALAAAPLVEPAAADIQRPARRGTAAVRPGGRIVAIPAPNHEGQAAEGAALALGVGPTSAAVAFATLHAQAQQHQPPHPQLQPQQQHQSTTTGPGFAASSGRPPLHGHGPDHAQVAPAAGAGEAPGDTSSGRIAPHLGFDRPDLEHLACVFNLHRQSSVATVAAAAAVAAARIKGETSDSHAAGMASSVASSSIVVWSFLEAADKLTAAYPAFANLSLNFSEPLPLAAAGGGEVGSGRWLQLEVSAALQRLLSDRLVALTLSGHVPYPLIMAAPPSPALQQHQQQEQHQHYQHLHHRGHHHHHRLQKSSSQAHVWQEGDLAAQIGAPDLAEGPGLLGLQPWALPADTTGLACPNPEQEPGYQRRHPTSWRQHPLAAGTPGAFTVADALNVMAGETAAAGGDNLGSSGDGYDVSGAGAPSRRRRRASPPPTRQDAPAVGAHRPKAADSLTATTTTQLPESGCNPSTAPAAAGSPLAPNGHRGSSGSAPTRGSPGTRRTFDAFGVSGGHDQGSDGDGQQPTEGDGSGAAGTVDGTADGGGGATTPPADGRVEGDGTSGDAAEPMDAEADAALDALMGANRSGTGAERGRDSDGSYDKEGAVCLAGTGCGSDPMDVDRGRAGGFRTRGSNRSEPSRAAGPREENSNGDRGSGGEGHGCGDDGGGGSSDGNGSHHQAGTAKVVRMASCGDGNGVKGHVVVAASTGDEEEGVMHDAPPPRLAAWAAGVQPRVAGLAAAGQAPLAADGAGGLTMAAAVADRRGGVAPPLPLGARLPPLLSRLSHLASLTIAADLGFPSPHSLDSITGLHRLQKLDMRGSKFMQVDGDASLLGRQAWLHVGNEHVAVVARCTSLTSLSLNHVHAVGGPQLVALTALSRLTSLALTDALSGNTVHGEHIRALAEGLPGLRSLEVGRVTCPPLHLMQPPPPPPAAAGAAGAEATGAGQPLSPSAGGRAASPAAPPSAWVPWGTVLGCFQGLTTLHLQVACSFETELLDGVATLPLLESFSIELLDVPPPQLAAMLGVLSAGASGGGNRSRRWRSSGGGADSGSPPHGLGAAAAATGRGGTGRPLNSVLRTLTLTACMLYDEHLALMGRLSHVRSIRLDQVDIRTRDPDGWTALSGLRCLESFSFRAWNNPVLSASNLCVLTNDSLAMMAANWPRLQQLGYCGKVTLTEKAEEHLALMPRLVSAEITGADGTSCRVWRSSATGQLLRTITLPYTTAKVSSRNGYVTYSDSDDSEGSEASVNWMGEVGYVTSEYDAD